MKIKTKQQTDLSIQDTEAPEHVLKNIEAIIALHAHYEESVPTHQRILEKIAATFGKAWFLYAEILFFTVWGICSHLADIGVLTWEFPRFDLHEQGIDVASLLISTGVLIYQARQEEMSTKNSHLTLQLNLLTEQKVAKLIALVEELRSDLPNVQDRHDPEAEVMQQRTDPQVVLDILQENLKQVVVTEPEVVEVE
ncbi:MAG: DUF1003 domain-containing protein [Calothrix sp. FI2-JRJ7]|jgi:uncharacterized membrane protein|nr:DUF1003 domain-containing protein [Calothrix sp. FI2-JRJ7]